MILVTGASGFVGRNLVPELVKAARVRILARASSDLSPFIDRKGIEIVFADLENDHGLAEALEGVRIVIHGAARTRGNNFIQFYKTNTQATANLAKRMVEKGVRGMILLSSHAACGPGSTAQACTESVIPRPISHYGRTKKMAEDIIRKSAIPYTILRPVSVYGPYDMEILKYIKILRHGLCPVVGFGEKYLDIVYVQDLVRLIVELAVDGRFDNRTYFVSDGNHYKFFEVIAEIEHHLGRRSIRLHIPTPLALVFGLMNDLFVPGKKGLVGRDKIRELAPRYWLCTDQGSLAEIGFRPRYSLKEGMAATIEWYRKNDLLA